MNLLSCWPGCNGKGTKWDLETARAEAARVIRRLVRGRVVVVLGKRTASALQIGADYFEPTILAGAVVYVVPHPSGVNRWYNDAANRATMAAFMRQIVRGGRP